jgi:hypothetical protein
MVISELAVTLGLDIVEEGWEKAEHLMHKLHGLVRLLWALLRWRR